MNKLNLFILLSLFFNSISAQETSYIAISKAKEDINFMIKTIESVHYDAYFKTDSNDFIRFKDSILKDWTQDSVSYKKFVLAGMQLSALMSGGHTALSWKNRALFTELRAFEYLPFTGKLDDSGNFMITRSATDEVNSEMEITHINGESVEDLYREAMTCEGGIHAFKNAYCEPIFPLYLFFTERVQAPYRLILKNGKEVVLSKGLDLKEFQKFANESTVEEKYTFEILADNIGYLSYNQCADLKAFKRFLNKTFTMIQKNGVDKLIIDIRENGGGNSELNDWLLNYITRKPYQQAYGRYWKVSKEVQDKIKNEKLWAGFLDQEFFDRYLGSPNQSVIKEFDDEMTQPDSNELYFNGTVCMLIGPKTFSSANYLADAVKTYEICTLIGMPTGEYTNDFGEQITFKLPNSGSYLFVSSTYDIGANKNFEIMSPVYPDIQVEDDPKAYAVKWLLDH
ncbi:hypothetical protein KFE94_16885 [bacterium SCSIO 12643]|nr:hypothetical protein KFE94_16885 [bacterium SCSIO 12643]